MRRIIAPFVFFLTLLWLSSDCSAQNIYTCDDGKISFNSSAPLELIEATSNEMRGAIDLSKRTFAFVVKITSFRGFNAELQRDHFNENYMESEEFPEATFKGKIIEEVDFSNQTEHVVRAKGTLTVHGVDQERIINVKIVVSENKVACEAKFPIQLSEHNITVPKVVHEKIASEVIVDVKAVLQKRQAP